MCRRVIRVSIACTLCFIRRRLFHDTKLESDTYYTSEWTLDSHKAKSHNFCVQLLTVALNRFDRNAFSFSSRFLSAYLAATTSTRSLFLSRPVSPICLKRPRNSNNSNNVLARCRSSSVSVYRAVFERCRPSKLLELLSARDSEGEGDARTIRRPRRSCFALLGD